MVKGSLDDGRLSDANRLQFLSNEQVLMIDEALASLGDFGEVRLSVRKGRLRFLVMQKSFDALQWDLTREEPHPSLDGS